MFGMTTRSVHQYVLGVLEKLGLDETQITKLQVRFAYSFYLPLLTGVIVRLAVQMAI